MPNDRLVLIMAAACSVRGDVAIGRSPQLVRGRERLGVHDVEISGRDFFRAQGFGERGLIDGGPATDVVKFSGRPAAREAASIHVASRGGISREDVDDMIDQREDARELGLRHDAHAGLAARLAAQRV